MGHDTSMYALSMVVAMFEGALTGIRINLTPLLVEFLDLNVRAIGPVITAFEGFSLVVNPFGIFLVGYLWGCQVDVETEYLRYVLMLFVSAMAGFAVAYVASLLPTLGPGSEMAYVLGRVALSSLVAFSLISVALIGLAGAAVAHFRHSPEHIS